MLRLTTKLNFCFCKVFDTVFNVNNIGNFERKLKLLGSVNHLFNNLFIVYLTIVF